MFCDKNGDGLIQQSADQPVSEVTQENHFYPFGLNMEGAWSNTPSITDNKYQYNGKELVSDFGLEWNDYGARNYDAAIGRWNAPDPMEDKYAKWSPYNYTKGNPVNLIDVNGMYDANPTDSKNTSVLAQDGSVVGGANSGSDEGNGREIRPDQYAAMAEEVYGNRDGSLLKSSGFKVSKRNFGIQLVNPTTGFKSQVYERTVDGVTQYVYAIAGSDGGNYKDWVSNNLPQASGLEAPQYKQAMDNASIIHTVVSSELNSELSFTGHSLGGGLAAASAYATGLNATTFNAAGVHKNTIAENPESKIKAFTMDCDPLSLLQAAGKILVPLSMPPQFMDVPPTNGTIFTLKHPYDPPRSQGKMDNAIWGHSMDRFLEYFFMIPYSFKN